MRDRILDWWQRVTTWRRTKPAAASPWHGTRTEMSRPLTRDDIADDETPARTPGYFAQRRASRPYQIRDWREGR